MPVVGPSSEVVKYLELKTRRDIAKGWTEHYFYQRGTSARNRKIILSERWRRIRKLGSGAFGSVWLEKCDRMVRKDAPSVRAVKEIKFNSGIDFTRELEAIAKFSNNEYLPSFVRCFGWFQINDSIFITMEHIEHGDLRKHLDDPMPEREANLIIGQLVEGLGHMHRNKFVHRDLKPENILVVEKGPGWLVQISDFGISRKLEDGRTIGTAQQGTLGYIAPEVMGFIDGKGLSFAADMWSLGAVLFRMLTRKTFLTYGDEHRKFVNGEKVVPVEELRRAGLSDSGLDFLQKLLVASPEARLTVDEATRHRWVSSVVNTTATAASTGAFSSSRPPSEVGDQEIPELGARGMEGTGMTGTGETGPSAQWSYSTANPQPGSILDELCLSDEDPEDELQRALLQPTDIQLSEAPPGRQSMAQPIPAVQEPEKEDGDTERSRITPRRARQRTVVVENKNWQHDSDDAPAFLEVATTRFTARRESRRHTSNPSISDDTFSVRESDIDEPTGKLLLEYKASPQHTESLGSPLPTAYQKPTVQDVPDEDLTKPTRRRDRGLFPIDTPPISEANFDSETEEYATLVNDPDETWNSPHLRNYSRQPAFISDGRTVWRRQDLDTLYIEGEENIPPIPFDNDNRDRVNDGGGIRMPQPRRANPRVTFSVPLDSHGGSRQWSGSESDSDSLVSDSGVSNPRAPSRSNQENQQESDELTQSDSDSESYTDSFVSALGVSSPTAPSPSNQGIRHEGDDLPHSDSDSLQSETYWSQSEDSEELGPSRDPTLVREETSQTPDRKPDQDGIKNSWPCYSCLRETPFRIANYFYSYRTKFCHQECGKVLCDECWIKAVKDFFLSGSRHLPRCIQGIPLDYDGRRRSVNLERIGKLYFAFKYIIETDALHCCPECTTLLSTKFYTTKRKHTQSGRAWRSCDFCEKRYCDNCLKAIDPEGSEVHGRGSEIGGHCRTWEEIQAYAKELERPWRRYGAHDKVDRVFLDACAYITRGGGRIPVNYHKEYA